MKNGKWEAKNIIFLVPTELEAEPFYCFREKINFYICGAGLVKATINSLKLFLKIKKRKIFILIGFAGAYPETDLETGDIIIASKEVWIGGERFFSEKRESLKEILKIERSIEFKNSAYELFEFVKKSFKEKGFKNQVIFGPLATRCNATYDVELAKRFRREEEVLAENMEGFGVLSASCETGVEFFEIRVISNKIEELEKGWNKEEALKGIEKLLSIF